MCWCPVSKSMPFSSPTSKLADLVFTTDHWLFGWLYPQIPIAPVTSQIVRWGVFRFYQSWLLPFLLIRSFPFLSSQSFLFSSVSFSVLVFFVSSFFSTRCYFSAFIMSSLVPLSFFPFSFSFPFSFLSSFLSRLNRLNLNLSFFLSFIPSSFGFVASDLFSFLVFLPPSSRRRQIPGCVGTAGPDTDWAEAASC